MQKGLLAENSAPAPCQMALTAAGEMHDMSDNQTAFPLAWPAGWPRTPAYKRDTSHRFGGRAHPLTFDRARRELIDELGRLRARNVIISTNLPLRNDGQPYAGAADRRMDDPGVAVYFRLKDRNLSMARDGFTNIAANMRSLFLAIDGMRQLERHGGSYMMERAFSGFAALPPPGPAKRSWKEVLGIWEEEASLGLTVADIEQAFRRRAKEVHPDSGGTHDAMSELNAARAEALKEVS